MFKNGINWDAVVSAYDRACRVSWAAIGALVIVAIPVLTLPKETGPLLMDIADKATKPIQDTVTHVAGAFSKFSFSPDAYAAGLEQQPSVPSVKADIVSAPAAVVPTKAPIDVSVPKVVPTDISNMWNLMTFGTNVELTLPKPVMEMFDAASKVNSGPFVPWGKDAVATTGTAKPTFN